MQINQQGTRLPETDKLFTVPEAADFLHLAVPTIYSMVSRAEIPVCKRSKRLYFSKQALTDYIKAGHKKTATEIDAEAEAFIQSRKGGQRGKK